MSKKKRFLGHWKEGYGYIVVDRGYGNATIYLTATVDNWDKASDWDDSDALAYVKSVADALNAAEIPKA